MFSMYMVWMMWLWGVVVVLLFRFGMVGVLFGWFVGLMVYGCGVMLSCWFPFGLVVMVQFGVGVQGLLSHGLAGMLLLV